MCALAGFPSKIILVVTFLLQLHLSFTVSSSPSAESRSSEDSGEEAASLSDSTRMDLEYTLEKNREEIVFQYGLYVQCMRISLQEMAINVKELCSYLLSINAFQSSINLHGKLLSGVRSELKKASTIHEVLDIVVENCSSYLNIGVFQCVVKTYGIDKGQEELKYPEHLKGYIEKHTIAEFVKINPKLEISGDDLKKLVLKLDIKQTCKLSMIIDLQKAIASIYGDIMPSAIKLYDITQGCVVVTFCVPASVGDQVFTKDKMFSLEENLKLHSLSVLWIEYDGHRIAESPFEKKFVESEDGHVQKQIIFESSAVINIESGDNYRKKPKRTGEWLQYPVSEPTG